MAMDNRNLRIAREIRNNENRATNCVAKNIEKSVSASAKQMDAIEKLTITGMLAQLPDSIRLTARLRAENPDASLEELRNLHNPPITKSGLNHRLQKILSEADKLN
jgi:DNA-binding protein WhiA